MASYESWNRAIAAYFTAGAAKGTSIFLSLEFDALDEIAERFLDEPADTDLVADFCKAVRGRCVQPWGTVNLDPFMGECDSVPAGVAFLGLMVYAANQMQDDGEINDLNYFLRLREALGLERIQCRPDGMPAGSEEPLWRAWNRYLTNAGFQPTAERGSGPQTYLRYVISQAILRECDKDYIFEQFREKAVPSQLDRDQLGFWLSRLQISRKHLREGLQHPDPSRVWEFYCAAHRAYETGDWLGQTTARARGQRTRLRNIECGLYRAEDLLGDAEHFLFPKQPGRTRATVLHVSRADGSAPVQLRALRAGFFAPMWKQTPFVPAAIAYPLSGDTKLQSMLFPNRDFWILTADPENPNGAWATWRPYLELGERVLVLCRDGAFDLEMRRFKEAKLLDWESRSVCDGYVEYRGCMVLSYDWGGFIATPECRSLADALAPRAMAGVSLIGGLRDPNQNAWLEGFPPEVKVYGFDKQFELTVNSAHGEEIFREDVQRQEAVCLPSLEPDTYQVEVKQSGKRVASRVFRVIGWDRLQLHPEPEVITNSSASATAGIFMRGAQIVPDPATPGEVHHA